MNFVSHIGVNLYVGGFILVGKTGPQLVMFPDADLFSDEVLAPFHYNLKWGWEDVSMFKPTLEEFEQIVRQMDIQETEITNSNGEKMIVRMTQRQLDSGVTWQVFDRDEYKCRYCGTKGIPMTFDHILRWEEGGDTTVENGVTACRKCNKQRGDTDYAEWLSSDIYKKKSVNVEEKFLKMNEALLPVYQGFAKRTSVRKR